MAERASKRRRTQQTIGAENDRQDKPPQGEPERQVYWNDQIPADELPGDTLVALQLLVSQFPAAAKVGGL